jgi:serine/threonine protein kinase
MYSLAGTCYHALTGRTPFVTENIDDMVMAHVNQALVPPAQLVEVTDLTNEAIVKALAKEPKERFKSYEEMILGLEVARTWLLRALYDDQPEAGAGAEV